MNRTKKPFFRILAAVVIVGLLTVLITGGMILLRGTGREGNFTYMIILGTGVNGDVPSSMLQDRIDAAARYMKDNPDVIAIATGFQAPGDSISEAQCIYNGLTQLGIAPDRILLEEEATSTSENFRYSLAILEEELGYLPSQIGVLSSEFHLMRAGMLGKHHGLDTYTIPAHTSDTRMFIAYFVREIFVFWHECAKLPFL